MAASPAQTQIMKQGDNFSCASEALDKKASYHFASSCQENPRVLSVLSSLLERTVAKNDKYVAQLGKNGSHHRLTVFHGLKAPSISVEKYVERIFKYANCSPSCFVVAYAYLDRFIHQQPGLPITSLNVHRLLITSVMVAAKFLDDAYYNNAYYAKVGGVNTLEMNRLELEFLFRLGFRLHVTVQVFDSYCSHLEREVAMGIGGGLHHQVERSLSNYCGSLVMSISGNNIPITTHHDQDNADQQQQKAVNHIMADRCSYVAINVLESVS